MHPFRGTCPFWLHLILHLRSVLYERRLCIYFMYRVCVECGVERSRVKFSRCQWEKDLNESRCKACVDGTEPFACWKCKPTFSDESDWRFHVLLHERRSPACSFCGTPNNGKWVYPSCFATWGLEKESKDIFRRIYDHVCSELGAISYATEPPTLPTQNDESWHHGTPVRPDHVCPTCKRVVHVLRLAVTLTQYWIPEGPKSENDGTEHDNPGNQITEYN